jgi:hypothetical protein
MAQFYFNFFWEKLPFAVWSAQVMLIYVEYDRPTLFCSIFYIELNMQKNGAIAGQGSLLIPIT